jgi:transcriptional regulator with XRE-family HTH domain
MMTIGAKILEIRKRKGLTQEKLSDLSNINLRTLQRIEKGSTEPRSDTINSLCQVLEVSAEDVLDYGKKDDLNFLKYFHLSVLTCMFFPLGNVILPLVLWLPNRNKIIDLNEQGVNVLNYQILWSLLFYFFFTLWFIFTIMHWPNNHLFLFALIGLYLLNTVYPLTVFKNISQGVLKRYYFNPIMFLK